MIDIQELLRVADSDQTAARLAEDVVFCSPVAEYRGRQDVTHMFGLISSVLNDLQPARTWRGDDGESVQAFTAHVAGRALEGIVREQQSETGQISRIVLFLRPYRDLRAAIEQMGARLAESPLPSTR